MDDMRLVANRFAKVAKDMVNESAAVAVDAFAKTNPKETGDAAPASFTAQDAVASMTRLVDIALRGSIAMARIPLQIAPDPNMMLAADHVAAVTGRGITQASRVLSNAAEDIERNGIHKDALAQTSVRLANIAMLRSAEIAQTIAAGPGRYQDPHLISDDFPIDPDPDNDRRLALTELGRPKFEENIAHIAVFDPADGLLAKGTSTFKLIANSAGIPSGVYQGTVQVFRLDQKEPDATIEVLFAL